MTASPEQHRDGDEFKGQVAVVTGASRGIGREIAIAFAQRAATVVVGFLDHSAEAKETLEQVQSLSSASTAVQADIRRPEQCERMIGEVHERFGRVDILVNNAGIVKDGFFHKMEREAWGSVLETNLLGMFNVTHSVIPIMRRRRYGRIVSISSVIAFSGNLGQTNYAASKAAVIGLTKSLALETAALGITVNCVAPGFITTKMTDNLPASIKEQLLQRIPMGRFGNPAEVADVVMFLAAPRTAYVTGSVFHVNGGLYL
jgi:3-oxoacyl-[acyl-carrier protein] reductase